MKLYGHFIIVKIIQNRINNFFLYINNFDRKLGYNEFLMLFILFKIKLLFNSIRKYNEKKNVLNSDPKHVAVLT